MRKFDKDRQEYIDKWKQYILELNKIGKSVTLVKDKDRLRENILELLEIVERASNNFALEEQIIKDYETRRYHGD